MSFVKPFRWLSAKFPWFRSSSSKGSAELQDHNVEESAFWIIHELLDSKPLPVIQQLVRMLNGKSIVEQWEILDTDVREQWRYQVFPTLAEWAKEREREGPFRYYEYEEKDYAEDPYRLLADVFYHLEDDPRSWMFEEWKGD
ncbi:hypothetical protein MPH_13858 [Macrophomina phaseolina MS6]|uniref:Uncharacterized protein n=1 Tax=Macrophomina phaseolina (strain MS6) TaxID=1126212 RepID=K2QHA3_MACPH|nr:hypothetical protein MPH_13858 [Macrophomina phaseolina MS6]